VVEFYTLISGSINIKPSGFLLKYIFGFLIPEGLHVYRNEHMMKLCDPGWGRIYLAQFYFYKHLTSPRSWSMKALYIVERSFGTRTQNSKTESSWVNSEAYSTITFVVIQKLFCYKCHYSNLLFQ
jgi:hypothetical protein